jgi:hypothetical protein
MTGVTISLICSTMLVIGEPGKLPRYGFLNQPAYSIDKCPRLPLIPYCPQPGDIVLYSDANIFWAVLYAIGGTGAPGHSGLVVRRSSGELAVLEAGYNDRPWIRLVALDERLRTYKGTCWVRRRKTPIGDEQSRILTEFAEAIDGRRYSLVRLLGQLTPFRSRGPIRTCFMGKPKGIRDRYICSEAVLEGLVLAGLLDGKTTRPSATYPKDLFFDSSPNPFINKHLKLCCEWEIPALWCDTR